MLREVAPGMIRSAQLCDARAESPVGNEAIILEARSGRLPPGPGHLPLDALLASLPAHVALGVEVPMGQEITAEEHARRVFEATMDLFARARAQSAATHTVNDAAPLR